VRKDGRYVLNGSKLWVTNGPVADVIVVFANAAPRRVSTGSAPSSSRGLARPEHWPDVDKMGMRTSPMAPLFLDDCEVAEENRLGREGAARPCSTTP